uniref:CCHC-type domain-containing protein n=1 Tax=Fagus sylvatica TaxID=28930 RepID=A0A2N9GTU3_FAGSY
MKESHLTPYSEDVSNGFSEDGEECEPASPFGTRSGISYKESLLGEILGAYEHVIFGNNMEEDGEASSDEDEPPEKGEVVIRFSCELKQRIKASWSTSLIVKVFGCSFGYLFLVNKLNAMWKSFGIFSCVDLGSGFFLIRFDSQSSFEEVLKRGLWFTGEHFLSFRPWVPNFKASEAAMSLVAVWLLILEGDLQRVYIKLDMEKPLARTVRVGKAKVVVLYEGIGHLCFHCGKIGHWKEWCPNRVTAALEDESKTSRRKRKSQKMENEEVMGGTSEPVDKVNLVDEDEDDDDLVEPEDVLVTVGAQERTAKRKKTSAVWAFFEMLPTKGDDDKPYCKCKKLGGPRAVELDKSFPFDGFLYTNTIGFAGVFGSYGSLMFWMWNIFALLNKRSMSQSRRFNKIVSLRNNVGKWITDSGRICHHIQQGFIDLFSTSHSSSLSGTNLPLKAPKISDTEASSLMDPINANDVFFLFTLPPLEPV